MNIDWDSIASEEDGRVIQSARQMLALMEEADKPEKDGGAGGFLCFFGTYKDLGGAYHFTVNGDRHTVIGLLRHALYTAESGQFRSDAR